MLKNKEEYAAELKFITFAKLNDQEVIKFFKVGEEDHEEDSEELAKEASKTPAKLGTSSDRGDSNKSQLILPPPQPPKLTLEELLASLDELGEDD